VKSEKELLKYLNDQRNIYTAIKELIEPTLTTQAEKDLIKELEEKLTICKFLRNDNEFDAFAVENYLNDEKVNGYYKSPDLIIKSYNDTDYFNVNVIPILFKESMNDLSGRKGITNE